MIDGHWTTCIQCECRLWLPPELYTAAHAQAGKITFFCAYGHPMVFRSKEQKREEDETRRERDRLKQAVAQLEDSVRWHSGKAQEANKKLELAVKDKARVAKRIHAGVCPHCNRTFTNMARHMSTKHKGEV